MKSSFLPHLSSELIEKAQLSEYTTFRLGGPCRGLIDCQTPEQLIETVQTLHENDINYILLGGGSNLVVSDEGVDCFVIRYVSDIPLIERDGHTLYVAASTQLDHLVEYAAQNGLEGINTCSGIPGTVGGAVVGNAGAYGKQIGDVLKKATLLSRDGNVFEVGPQDLDFSYRHSNLKVRDEIVVEIALDLKLGNKDTLMKERAEILETRRQKHPDLSIEPCAGSFFRNIEPSSKAGKRQATGWFLDEAGGKKLKSGGAYIFPKHANIIIKGEGCTAKDVYELSRKMAALAKEKFDLDLVREVRFVGKIDDMPKDVKTIIW